MSAPRSHAIASTVAALVPLLLFSTACAAQAPEPRPRTVQPGAPGEESRALSAADVARTALPSHTEADIRFMQGMLVHHAQALVMTDMVADRTNNPDIRLLARRIELSQDDELLLMRHWLQDRGEPVPVLDLPGRRDGAEGAGGAGTQGAQGAHDPAAHGNPEAREAHEAHGAHGAGAEAGAEEGAAHPESMHGMLSREELARLAAASGAEFDRLFLEFMIRHHQGAITMVQELFASPGSGQEEEIFQFASHVEADQNIEIVRMRGLLDARR